MAVDGNGSGDGGRRAVMARLMCEIRCMLSIVIVLCD